MTRAAHAAGMDAKRKLQEIAAKTLGGTPDVVRSGERTRVRRRPQHDARAGGAEGDRARRQVRRPRGPRGRQRVHEAVGGGARRPGADGRRARQLPGRAASRSRSSPGSPKWKSTSRPGQYHCSTTSACVDVGTVLHPRNLGGQILGRSMLGHRPRDRSEVGLRPALRRRAGEAVLSEQAADDPRCAARACSGPRSTFPIRGRRWARKGIGEPPVAAGCCAMLNALSDALGDDVIRRAPVRPT